MAFPQWSTEGQVPRRSLLRRASHRDRHAASLSLLTAALESTGDGILVVDRAGRVVGHNSRFAVMWGLDPELLRGPVPADLLPAVSRQVVDPAGFEARALELHADPEQTCDDEVELADGRVFGRHTQPQTIDGRVVGRVWSYHDLTAERRLQRGLQRLAYTDDLTGLPNRAMFMSRGRAMADAARDGGHPLAVAVLDLDHLKDVNDRLGHQAGDEVIRVAATRLRAAARAVDLVARLGGDEFGVLLPDASPATAAAVMQRMADAMSGAVSLSGRTVTSTLSGGSSVGSGAVSLETLLHEADLAMYRAKADGRGRVRAFDDEVSRADPRTAAAEVHDILADPDGLITVLQPICRLSSGLLVGHEALARFPGRGHREVGEWFSLARASAAAAELEARSIRQARAAFDPCDGTYLTVNVSPSVLGSVAVQEALAGDLTGLVVEVTEDSRLDLGELSRLLDQLRGRGGLVAMDDTGAGYDGLRRLVRLRPEIVKLDRELVHELHQHPDKRAMVEAMVSFCRQTGASLCAEGIETVEELRTLVDLGVHLGQGWLVGRPAVGRPAVAAAALAACGSLPGATPLDLQQLRAELDRARTPFEVSRAVQRGASQLHADDVGLALVDGGDLLQVEAPGWTSLVHRFVLADYPATARALADGEPLTVRTDDPEADRAEVRNLREVGFGSVVVLPLLCDSRAIGILEVFSRAQRSFSDREMRLGRQLADEVADALDRIERSTPTARG